MPFPPVVYAGPSVEPETVRRLLPKAVVKGPISRGDLYRDRMLLYSVFVIIDGVFFQNDAVSPRECIDVCRDGGTVIGASSMGALRAAECSAAGMLGVGTIFRMFRAGLLRSDDEVAVTFDPDDPRRLLSLPLINVRYAASRAVRDGIVDQNTALRLVDSARELYYADRRWGVILANAGLRPRSHELEKYLKRHDLKGLDARKALETTAALLRRNPGLGRTAHLMKMPFVRTERTREAEHLALSGMLRTRFRKNILRWAFGTGLYRTLLDGPSASAGGRPFRSGPPLRLGKARIVRLWRALEKSDAALYRWRAHDLGVTRAKERDVRPDEGDLAFAEGELASGHGLRTWRSLHSRYRNDPEAWSTLVATREEIAVLRALRRLEGGR